MDEATFKDDAMSSTGKDYVTISDTSNKNVVLRYMPLWYVVAVLFIGVFGMVGNIMTLTVLLKRKTWTSVNVLIGIMSFSDLLVLPITASIPLQIFVDMVLPEKLSYIKDLLVTSSCLCAAIIGCERSFAVRSPLKFKQQWNTKLTIKIYLVAYGTCLCIVITRPLVSELISYQYFKRYFYVPYFIIIRGIPFIVILVTNILVILGLIRNRRRMSEMSQGFETDRLRKETAVSRTVAFISTIYFICLIPGRMTAGLWHAGIFNDDKLITYFVTTVFEIINFSVNIIIYTATSTFFRKEYFKLLSFCFRRSVAEAPPEFLLKTVVSGL